MDFFKNFFNDDEQVVGLCPFKKQQENNFRIRFEFEPKFKPAHFVYDTNTAKNFFLL